VGGRKIPESVRGKRARTMSGPNPPGSKIILEKANGKEKTEKEKGGRHK